MINRASLSCWDAYAYILN
jgi:hypothetical protein